MAIRGAFHFTFSDDGATVEEQCRAGVLRTFRKLGIDARRQLAVTTYCVHSLLRPSSEGNGRFAVRISSPLYPEIKVLE